MDTFKERIEKHQPLVMSIAKQIHKRLPRFITFEDVLSYGQVGLTQASRTYQPRPGTKFSSYAYYRITGAIYDGIARMNWTSRAEYRRYKALREANSVAEANSGGADCDDPEKDAQWFTNTVENLAVVYVFSSADDDNPIENQLVGAHDAPEDIAERNELCGMLHHAIGGLDEDEQQLVQLTYFEGQSLAEAAKSLGRSRSWGSRTHSKILKVLGTELLGEGFEAT